MTNEQKAAILAEARATLERPLPEGLPPLESRNDRWRREATEAEAERKAERDSRLTDAQAAILEARLVGRVASEREFVLSIVAETLALIKQQILDQVAEQIGELRADRTIDKSDNVLPAFLRKRS